MSIDNRQGFTLIELSMVLVIIGLIVGGILVGQDLIKGAQTRAQIAQIEKYNAAVHAFQNKYGGLPGDLALNLASQFGFGTLNCDGSRGNRNGDGMITGTVGGIEPSGELSYFWLDLSSAGYIDGTFPNSGAAVLGCTGTVSLSLSPGTQYVGDYYPQGKIGNGTFLYVYNTAAVGLTAPGNNANWFGLSAVTGLVGGSGVTSNPGISVMQAYNIDKKMDDGFPVTGSVQDAYINGTSAAIFNPNGGATDNNSTCYNTTTNTYSTNATNGGLGLNCALSFKFQ